MADETDSPGWAAIDAALEPLYKGQEPLHFGTAIPYSLGGPDPIHGISAYRRSDPDHWHIVTYGFTELWQKETEDPGTSGYGFELTMRVARAADETQAPMWALNFLQNLGRYVFGTGNVFGIGHHMPLNSPICLGADTAIDCVAFGADPELGEFRSTNGAARFIQVVGITTGELDLIMEWNTVSFLKEVASADPLLLTDLKRRSLLSDAVRAASLRARAAEEGSSMGFSHLNDQGRFHEGPPVVWEVGAFWVNSILRGLRGRILHGRPYSMEAPDRRVEFRPEASDGAALNGTELMLRLSPAVAKEMLGTLRPARGDYRWPSLPGFVIRVVPTEIKDKDGKVAEVVG